MENLISIIYRTSCNIHNQPYLFEPLASGHDSSDNNSRESTDSASEDGGSDHVNVNQEQIGQVDGMLFSIPKSQISMMSVYSNKTLTLYPAGLLLGK